MSILPYDHVPSHGRDEMKHAIEKISNHMLQRTARKRAAHLNYEYALATGHGRDQREIWLRRHDAPLDTDHFAARSSVRGPFGWKVVAVRNKLVTDKEK